MADNRASKHTAADKPTADVDALSVQRDEANAVGDTDRAAQLDEQIRQAEAK